MISMPQVSVIMPTFEQSRFIRRALDSLMAQTLTRGEQMVRDRGQMQALRARVWETRDLCPFDHHVPALLDFFQTVIAGATSSPARNRGTA